MTKLLRNLVLGLLLAMSAVACSTVQQTGRSQLLLTSEAEEMQMGNQAWQQVLSQEKVSSNPTYNAAVNRIGRNIAAVANAPNYQWEFKVLESSEPNAFCLPGGKVAVYTGLFKYADNDAELAAVVGHEVAHAIARHGGERVSQGLIQQLGAAAVAASVDSAHVQEWLVAYGFVSQVGGILPYSRIHEYEADEIGLVFMAKAGYDPRAAVSFWKKFGELGTQDELGEFFSTHPMGDKRLQEMQNQLPRAWQIYQNTSVKHGLGQQYRQQTIPVNSLQTNINNQQNTTQQPALKQSLQGSQRNQPIKRTQPKQKKLDWNSRIF